MFFISISLLVAFSLITASLLTLNWQSYLLKDGRNLNQYYAGFFHLCKENFFPHLVFAVARTSLGTSGSGVEFFGTYTEEIKSCIKCGNGKQSNVLYPVPELHVREKWRLL